MASDSRKNDNVPAPYGGANRTVKKKIRFLEGLETYKSVSHARRYAGISRSTAYRWRDEDPPFAEAWDDVLESAIDDLEASALQRATSGSIVEQVLDSDGNVLKEKRVWETGLTVFMLKTRRKPIYNIKQGETGEGDTEAHDFATRIREAHAAMRASVPTVPSDSDPDDVDVDDGQGEAEE